MYCFANRLTSLKGAPRIVNGSFWCHENQLASLEGAPQVIRWDFYCDKNKLTSLEHGPQSVGNHYACHDNDLTSLQGAPTVFKRLSSPFGVFWSWDEVPEKLRPACRESFPPPRRFALKIDL